jgi:hypothetical protein
MNKLDLYKLLATDESVFIQKIADVNGAYTTNGSVVQNQGFTEVERAILFEQIKQQQKVIDHLLDKVRGLEEKQN